ncbi:MAG TPA: outer membrane lipoprotein-sorting protein, partial [Caulobacteraceae bacterium]|nr:outer membrane lipoprotein-sorting protein [Caulobacteraceae bacterium]
MRRSIFLPVLGIALGMATAAAAAGPPGAEAILRRMYDNYRAASSETQVTMTIHRPTWERSSSLTAWTRGDDDALVRFTAPAKDAGNATLKLKGDTWVYNPRLNQMIKLPASMLSQSWMGSDFSYDDLAKSEDVITLYTSKLAATDTAGGHQVWTIEATPKPGAPVVWGKVALKIRDDDVLVGETFYDQDQKPARRLDVDKVGALGGR